MKKQFFFPFILLSFIILARPPVAAQSLIGVVGNGSMTNGSIRAEYAVGEIAIATMSGTPSVTQGLLQPHYLITATNDIFDIHYTIKCYPNPVKDELIIETDYPDFSTAELYNALGQRLLTQPFNGQSVNMSGISTGSYVLYLVSKEKSITKPIKIIKQ